MLLRRIVFTLISRMALFEMNNVKLTFVVFADPGVKQGASVLALRPVGN